MYISVYFFIRRLDFGGQKFRDIPSVRQNGVISFFLPSNYTRQLREGRGRGKQLESVMKYKLFMDSYHRMAGVCPSGERLTCGVDFVGVCTDTFGGLTLGSAFGCL